MFAWTTSPRGPPSVNAISSSAINRSRSRLVRFQLYSIIFVGGGTSPSVLHGSSWKIACDLGNPQGWFVDLGFYKIRPRVGYIWKLNTSKDCRLFIDVLCERFMIVHNRIEHSGSLFIYYCYDFISIVVNYIFYLNLYCMYVYMYLYM